MLKKIVGLVVAVAAVATLAIAPVSASGDYIPLPAYPHHSCKTASDKKNYCEQVCKVPQVVGERLRVAKALIKKHGCRVGKVEISERDKDKKHNHKKDKKEKHEKLIVHKQSPKHSNKVYPLGTKVNLFVKG